MMYSANCRYSYMYVRGFCFVFTLAIGFFLSIARLMQINSRQLACFAIVSGPPEGPKILLGALFWAALELYTHSSQTSAHTSSPTFSSHTYVHKRCNDGSPR